MSERLTDGSALIAETVGRLRSVQEDFADEPAEIRQQHLREELDRAMARLVPDRRQAFLSEVLRRFPNWDSGNGQVVAAAPPPVEFPSDPETLVEKLIESCEGISPERMAAIRSRLAAGGLVSAGAAWEEDITAKLKLPANSTPTPERVVEALSELISSADKIDDMAWKTWRQLDRQGVRRKPSDLRNIVIGYVSGISSERAPATTEREMSERIELFRRLASSLIYELREIETFARQQAERFSPEKIEQVSKSGMLESPAAACWRTFQKIAADYDAAAVEQEIRKRIAQHVEENLR